MRKARRESSRERKGQGGLDKETVLFSLLNKSPVLFTLLRGWPGCRSWGRGER